MSPRLTSQPRPAVADLTAGAGRSGGTFRLGPGCSGLGPVLVRGGWSCAGSGDADIEVRRGAQGYLGLADGRAAPLPDVAAVSAWAAAVSRSGRVARRADAARVEAALADAAVVSAYVTADNADGVPLRALYGDRAALGEAVARVGRRLGVAEARVAASALHFGIVTRVWSVAIGALAAGGVVPDVDRVRFRLTGDAFVRLSLPEPGGWTAPADPAPLLSRLVVDEHLRPLHRALRAATRVAEGLLWGNAAAALRMAAETGGDPARRLFGTPELAAALSPDGTRRSCCLYYRAHAGAVCGDCPLDGAAVTACRGKPQATP
ncbi:(2Fe-2S)-binding protein [Actinokineospora iranica]|uniref:FhuF 2Fe-2S C-terminal domain-containing protein n=1 Tax=Actinokineospora iranica TaxID=1271860 RepID=A0A1G6U479_9PSEU|nr:(2Fe-2S)-binding protein [Actinokineospora iranica]SDD36180.1 FhuF 2Fe-2S C-terminal domain-containing protein [Actinokineospora iranica]